MADGGRKPSFLETVPGVITAIAALITAFATLITALYTAKIIGQEEPAKKEAVKEQGEANKQQEDAPAENQVERKASVPETATKEPVEIKHSKQETITDPVTGMEFVYIPGGCFMMGSPPEEEGRGEDEGPVHKVCLDGFFMSKYEVTQEQWQKIIGTNPSHSKKGGKYPVENVSWNDTQDFVKKLNSRSGKKYRLPTEAEWEYACRANRSGRYCGGDDVDTVAWYNKNSMSSTHEAGRKKINDFGLYDMSGNISEWCGDWYVSDYYISSPKSNPQGPENASSEPEVASFHVFRGGNWMSDSPRAAGRAGSDPYFYSDFW